MFRDKTKRIAHVGKFNQGVVEELKRKRSILADLHQIRAPNPIASGTLSTGNILSNKKFLKLIEDENELTTPESSSMSDEDSCSYNGMTLRARNRNFTYNEYFLIDRYRSEAYYSEIQASVRGSTRTKPRKIIVATRNWNQDITKLITLNRSSGRTMTWDEFLLNGENICRIAPVQCFKKAPLCDVWSQFALPGMVIEFRNPFFYSKDGLAYWFGTIMYFAGYLALVKLEQLNDDLDHKAYLAWISFCSDEPKPLGWCEQNDMRLSLGELKPLNLTEKMMEAKLREFYSKPHRTLQSDHFSKIIESVHKGSEFNLAIPVEVVDVDHLHETRLGKISSQVGGFVHVALYQDNTDQQGLWLSIHSNLIHPFGWSNAVGVKLNGIPQSITIDYSLDPNDFQDESPSFEITEGMLLEMRHPILIFKFVGAMVVKVLNYGYFVVQTLEKCTGTRVQFVVHVRYPLIFPWGWTSRNNLPLDRCKFIACEGRNLPLELLPEREPSNFTAGMKLEAVDPLNSKFVFPATVQKVVGHMLLLHADNTEFSPVNTLWVDCEQGEIFPAGYAELVGFKFKGHV